MADASVARAPRRVSVKRVLAMALIASPLALLIFNPLKSTAPSPEIELTLPPRPAESEYRKTPSAREQEHAALPAPETATRPVPSKPKLAETRPAANGRTETGRASWYALDNATASGEALDDVDLTAAHPSLPLGTKVLVENLDNGRFVVVRINDRGPFTQNRIIDLSKAAAEKLGMVAQGVANVRVSRLEGGVASLPATR
jgi:peptidoglycan lytic transglycosylase